MSPTVTPFSELLRRRSRTAAGPAVWTGGAHDLLAGECDVADYADLLGQYAVVYDALERAAERMADHPVAAPFVTTQLTHPDAAIRADLEYLVGPDWSELCCPTAATTAYVRRLCAVAATSPGAFVAHHYTRYLGDLTGGPTLARLLEDRFGFDTNGVLFTIFDQVADPAAFGGHVPGAARRGTLVRRRTRCRARRGRAGGEPGPGARGVGASPDGRGRPRRVAAPRLTAAAAPRPTASPAVRPDGRRHVPARAGTVLETRDTVPAQRERNP